MAQKKKRKRKADAQAEAELADSMQPPTLKDPSSTDIVYNKPGSNWVITKYQTVNLLLGLGFRLKATWRKGRLSVDVDEIDKGILDRQNRQQLKQYLKLMIDTGLTDKVSKRKGQNHNQATEKELDSFLNELATANSALTKKHPIVTDNLRKLSLACNLVDKTAFVNSKGNVTLALATPQHMHTSFRQWLTREEIKSLAQVADYIAAFYDQDKTSEIDKEIASGYVKNEKTLLQNTMIDIKETFGRYNRTTGRKTRTSANA